MTEFVDPKSNHIEAPEPDYVADLWSEVERRAPPDAAILLRKEDHAGHYPSPQKGEATFCPEGPSRISKRTSEGNPPGPLTSFGLPTEPGYSLQGRNHWTLYGAASRVV